jgi:hypothetical protein
MREKLDIGNYPVPSPFLPDTVRLNRLMQKLEAIEVILQCYPDTYPETSLLVKYFAAKIDSAKKLIKQNELLEKNIREGVSREQRPGGGNFDDGFVYLAIIVLLLGAASAAKKV